MCQIVLSSVSVDEFSREWIVFKSNYPLTSLSWQKIHIIRRCIPCQAMNWTWSDNRNFPKLAKNSGQLRLNSTFFRWQTSVKWLPAADRKHVNTLCSDTIKCRLDAGKAPYFDRKVRVRINPYESLKGLTISSHNIQMTFPKRRKALTSVACSFFVDDVQESFKRILKRDDLLYVGAVLCEV